MKVRLGDVCTIKQGVVKDTSTSVWLLNLDKVESETGKIIEYQFVEPNKVGASTCQFDTGNVLYSKLRPYLNKVVLPDKEGFATSEMLPIRPDTTKILREYLTYYLRSPEFVAYISDKVAGAKMPRARTEDLLNVRLQLPTLDEQTDIVKILSIVSTLITQRKQQLCQLDELIKSQFIEMFGDPESNPYGWDIVNLSEIADCFIGLTYKPENVSDTGTIVLRSSNIQNSKLDLCDIVRVNIAVRERLIVKNGDILMCSRNGSASLVGKVAYISNLPEEMTFGAFMTVVRSKYNKYLHAFFESDCFRNQIAGGSTTTINQITKAMLDKITLPLPSLELQNQFATFVEQTDKSKFEIGVSLEKLEVLKNALMQESFG